MIRKNRYRYQRELDLEKLWPRLKRQAAGNIEIARNAFTYHCLNSRAWRELGEGKIIDLVTTLS